MVFSVVGCIEDGFTTSPSDQPVFSTDTLDMGVVYTAEQTATYRLIVYNRHDRGLNLSSVAMSGENAGLFRLNVDGIAGTAFSNVEIRENDSIFVFLSADLPASGQMQPKRIQANLDFVVNGVLTQLPVRADGQDIHRMRGVTVSADSLIKADAVYQVKDSLVVAEGATLKFEPGVRMLFHDGARLIVRGAIRCEGTPEQPVVFTGDRTGNVITDVSFDLMSRQWSGVEFETTSIDNYLQYTEIRNTSHGVQMRGDGKYSPDIPAALVMINSRFSNSGGYALSTVGASVEAYGCEFSDAALGLIHITGGSHRFEQCTTANYYLFSWPKGNAWTFIDPTVIDDPDGEYLGFLPTKAVITNSISFGLRGDVTPGDLSGWDVQFLRCSFLSKGEDDDNFVDSLWDTDPEFYTKRNEYILDYRLKPESPVLESAFPALNTRQLTDDFYGQPRGTELGAYSYVAPPQEPGTTE